MCEVRIAIDTGTPKSLGGVPAIPNAKNHSALLTVPDAIIACTVLIPRPCLYIHVLFIKF